jgi:WD40 repeat protein
MDLTAEADYESPYLGLRTFEESDAPRYFGRTEAAAELNRMIKRASLIVLFGVSGTGKSSLLRAGVLPLVRAESHLPILIRLGYATSPLDLRAQIHGAIAREIVAKEIDAAKPAAGSDLREYFARNPFWTKKNKLITPLLIFDQFEEIFTIGREHQGEVTALIDELTRLTEQLPRELATEIDGVIAPRPRILLTLREDFLADLEDYRTRIPAIVGNRFRLTRMNGVQALEAVRAPAGELLTDATALEIVHFVAEGARGGDSAAARPLETLEVEPAILSLVCQQLDLDRHRAGQPQITADQLVTHGSKIVEDFYDSAFKGQPLGLRLLVEDHLVTSDGYRTTMAKAAALDIEGVTEEGIASLLRLKILREEVRFGSLHVELIHDRLTKIASEGRARRLEQKLERDRARVFRRKLWTILAGVTVVLLATVAVLLLVLRAQHARVREDQDRDRNTQLAELLVNTAREALLRGDTRYATEKLARARELHVTLPPEATLIKRRAQLELRQESVIVNHGSDVDCLRILDGGQLLTCSRDGSMRLWELGKQLVGRGASSSGPFNAVYAASDGSKVAYLRDDGSGEIRDTHEPDQVVPFEAAEDHQAPIQNAPQTHERGHWHACFTPDANRIAVWNQDTKGARLRELGSGKTITVLPDKVLQQVECTKTGLVIVARGSDPVTKREVFELGLATFAGQVKQLKTAPAMKVAAAADGGVIVASLGDKTKADVEVVQADGKPGAGFSVPPPDTLQLDPSGVHLLVTSKNDDGTLVTVWQTPLGILEHSEDHPNDVRARIAGAPGSAVVTVASGKRVDVWDLASDSYLGAAMFDFALDNAKVQVRKVGAEILVAAPNGATAVLRPVGMSTEPTDDPYLAFGRGMATAWPITPRALVDAEANRGGGGVSLELLGGTTILLRKANGSVETFTASDGIIDARIAPANGDVPLRIAVLHGSGKVTIQDEHGTQLTELHAAPAHAIRWLRQGELITLGWTTSEIWSDGGSALGSLPTGADDAQLTFQDDVVWTCRRATCSAWDPRSSRLLAEASLPGSRARLALSDSASVAVVDETTFLLPHVRNREQELGYGAIRTLADDGDLLVATDRATYQYTGGTSFVPVDLGKLAASIAAGAVRSADALALVEVARHWLWSGGAELIAARTGNDDIGLVTAGLDLARFVPKTGKVTRHTSANARIPGALATLSPDGGVYAIATPNGRIEIRDAANPPMENITAEPGFQVGTAHPRALLVSDSEPRTVVALTDEGFVIGNVTGSVTTNRGLYAEAAIDRRARWLVLQRFDHHAEIWQLDHTAAKQVQVIEADHIAIAPDGDHLAAAGNGKLSLYFLDEDKVSGRRQQSLASPSDLELGNHGKYIWLEQAHAFVTFDGSAAATVEAGTHCAFSDDNRAICSYPDRTVRMIDVTNGHARTTGSLPRGADAVVVCRQKSGARMAALVQLGPQSALIRWDPDVPKAPPEIAVMPRQAACHVEDDRVLATLADDGTRLTWGAAPVFSRHGLLSLITVRGPAFIFDTSLTPARFAVAIGTTSKPAKVLSLEADPVSLVGSNGMTHAVFVDSHQFVGAVAADARDELHVWDLDSSHPDQDQLKPMLLPTHVSRLIKLDQDRLAIALEDGSVTLWPSTARLVGDGARVSAIAEDKMSGWLAVGHDDGIVELWGVSAVQLLVRLDTHSDGPVALVFEPEGSLVTGTPNGEVKRWLLADPGLPAMFVQGLHAVKAMVRRPGAK